jgi:DNA replication protein DnaC
MKEFGTMVSDILGNAPQEVRENIKQTKELYAISRKDAVLDVIEAMNTEVDEEGMKEIPCDICHGKGFITVYDEEKNWHKQIPCKCMRSRRALRFVDSQGLLPDVKRCTFATYQPYDKATTDMKEAAKRFLKEMNWLLLSGQSGSGKSHLAYAIFGDLVKHQYAPVWMRWIQESQDLKMSVGEEDYDKRIAKLQNADVLIIDDLFNLRPTEADIRLARIIIDHRYTNKLPTVITTELTLGEINDYDDAIAGRIAEMSIVYQIAGKQHNYRMRNYL